jgi:hypothetical protein
MVCSSPMRPALALLAVLTLPASAHAAADGWASLGLLGDTRRPAGLSGSAGGEVDGLGCTLVEGQATLELVTSGPAANLAQEARACAWHIGIVDPRVHQAFAWQVEPQLADRPAVAAGPYSRVTVGVSIEFFDLRAALELFNAFAGKGEIDDEDGLALVADVLPESSRIIAIVLGGDLTRTWQGARELREATFHLVLVRLAKERGDHTRTIDILAVDTVGVDDGSTVGVMVGVGYPVRLTGLELGRHLELDAELGFAGTGESRGAPATMTTPPALVGRSATTGRLALYGRFGRVRAALTAERTLLPTIDLGLTLDSRVTGSMVGALGETDVTIHGFGARTERTGTDGVTTTDATYGGGLIVARRLPHRLSVEARGELARSFYASLDGAPPRVAPGARAMLSMRLELGRRR